MCLGRQFSPGIEGRRLPSSPLLFTVRSFVRTHLAARAGGAAIGAPNAASSSVLVLLDRLQCNVEVNTNATHSHAFYEIT